MIIAEGHLTILTTERAGSGTTAGIDRLGPTHNTFATVTDLNEQQLNPTEVHFWLTQRPLRA